MSKRNKYQNIADEECKQAVIFARVSSEEQKKGASIDAQLKTVIDYCDNRKFKILDKFSIVESSTRGGRLKFNEIVLTDCSVAIKNVLSLMICANKEE